MHCGIRQTSSGEREEGTKGRSPQAMGHLQATFLSLRGREAVLAKWGVWVLILALCAVIPPITGFPGGSAGKESACNAGDLGWIPGLGRSSGEVNSYPLQYSDLEKSMDWNSMESQSQTLSDFHFHSSNCTLCTLLAPKTDTAKNSLQLQQ